MLKKEPGDVGRGLEDRDPSGEDNLGVVYRRLTGRGPSVFTHDYLPSYTTGMWTITPLTWGWRRETWESQRKIQRKRM